MTTTEINSTVSGGRTGGEGVILQSFATPVARVVYPYAAELNSSIAEVVLGRLAQVDNKFTYKSETGANMTSWGEPLVDALSAWVFSAARRFVETSTGRTLSEAYAVSAANDADTYNGVAGPSAAADGVSIVAPRSWASVYRRGDQHESHFHPNTAIAAIYYVEGPDECELDLLDPRANIDYFDPGISFAGEGHNLRLRCAPGELVLFPGWLKHAVPAFQGDGVRMSLSWNLGYARVPTVK